MGINVCIPTLNRYDTLAKCIESINNSDIQVDNIYIVDNGTKLPEFEQKNIHIYNPQMNIGVARSWNWFIQNTQQTRIICNDDVEFSTDTIRRMLEASETGRLIFPSTFDTTNAFSCFLLPDEIINVVGLFDETISPNYAYFEDNDYHRRLILAGFGIKEVMVQTKHWGSSTIKNFSPAKLREHHEKFRRAQANYKKKWGGVPGAEIYTKPFNEA